MLRKFLWFFKLYMVLALSLAGVAYAADDECAGWIVAESTVQGATERICTITSTFTNLTEGAVGERSLGMAGATNVRLLRIEVRSTNCAAGLCDVTVQTVTGANAGTAIWTDNNLIAYTPETGGAAYTCYANELVDAPAVPTAVGSERRMYIRVTNDESEATNDEDVTVITTWGS